MNNKLDIKLLRINALRGPNVWTYRQVLEVWLDLGELEDWPSHKLPGFNERLLRLLPALAEHKCGVGDPGGFALRLREGTWAGHILEHVVIELLNQAGLTTGFGQTRSTARRGIYRMVFRARDEQVGRDALAAGHDLLRAALQDLPFDVKQAVTRLCERVDDCFLGPSTAAIVAAATARHIPHIRLNDGNLVQLGYGARQRRIWTAETEFTSAIAEGIASDKDLTKSLLQACGVPVPQGEVVASADAAWQTAQDIGLPVVVKPSDGNHGRGVSLDLTTRDEVEAAFEVAANHGSEVLVERFVDGHEHRLLVVGGKVVAAARGETASVTGDGKSSVRELVDAQINTDPRRGLTEDFPLNRIILGEDETVLLDLQRQGLGPQSVPAAGRRVLIQRNGNVSIDCTAQVHPEVAHAVSLAARVVGLDIAGVDVVARDISRPLAEQGGAIVEVNAGPGLLMHIRPAQGESQPVGRAIVDHLFPETEAAGRIPIVGVAGSRDTATIARLIAWLVQLSGQRVGLASHEGLFLDRRAVERGGCTGWDAGQRLLMNNAVQTAVFENDALAILEDGLAYDRCRVGVVTDLDIVAADRAPLDGHEVREAAEMAKVLRTQVDVVLPDGAAVLNADEAGVADLARLCDGEVIFYAASPQCARLISHRAAGGRVVFVRDGRAVLAHGDRETVLVDLSSAMPGRVPGRVLATGTLLAAVAAGWALDISAELIAAGIETFDADSPLTPAARAARNWAASGLRQEDRKTV